MFCEICGSKIESDANFCSNCGHPSSQELKQVHIDTGKSSVNIGVGNLPNSNIHIGDNISKEDEPLVYEMNKTANSKLPIKAFWATLAGALGVAGSIASLYSVVANGLFTGTSQGSWFFTMLPVSMILLVFGIILLKTKFIWLQFFGFALDKQGFIRFVRLKGRCPLCTGGLSVRYLGPNGARSIVSVCSRNPQQHRFDFDPTWLDNL